MPRVSSIKTIEVYERVLVNLFDKLSFVDCNYDINILKKNHKSNQFILVVLASIIFYIKYHFKKKYITKEVEEYIKNNTLYIKDNSKIRNDVNYDYILKFYSDAITQINMIIKANKCIKKNKSDNGKYPLWEDIINIDVDKLSKPNQHIYNIYTLMPFRRLEEYIKMVYIFDQNLIDLNEMYKRDRDLRTNYCYLNKDNPEQSKFIFLIYKTDRFSKNKPIKVTIWKQLRDYLLEFVENNNIQNGDKFLDSYNIKVSTSSNLSHKLRHIFGYSVDVLRHSYIQHIHKLYNKKVIDYKDLIKISKLMGHKFTQQIRYYNQKI